MFAGSRLKPSLDSENVPNHLPAKEDCQYTKYYCEENIWLFVNKIKQNMPDKIQFCYPVFVSNSYQHIPLWKQSASLQEDGLVVWDYHVIMVYSEGKKSYVYDFDSQLNFPTEFGEYCEKTFKTDSILKPSYYRFFRVLSGESYLNHFSSDRRHMKNEDGTWKKPPPTYPPIRNDEEYHNLELYIAMNKENKEISNKFGNVLDLNSFLKRFLTFKGTTDIDYMYPPEPSCL